MIGELVDEEQVTKIEATTYSEKETISFSVYQKQFDTTLHWDILMNCKALMHFLVHADAVNCSL